MVRLNTSDTVHLELVRGELYSDGNHQICFNGFLYDPSSPDLTNIMNATAWSVHRTSGATTTSPRAYLTYEDVDVNERDVYDAATGEVTIDISGYYFLNMNAGAAAGQEVHMSLVVNEEVECSVRRESAVHSGADTLGRSYITYLEEGDVVRTDIWADTSVYSDAQRQTSFTGFLIVNR